MGWRAAAGLADADPGPDKEQLREILRGAAQRGHAAPDCYGERNDIPAHAGVGPARNWYSQGGVDGCECDTGQHAELDIAQAEIGNDCFAKNVDDLPIEEIEDVNDREQIEYEVAVGRTLIRVLCLSQLLRTQFVCRSGRLNPPRLFFQATVCRLTGYHVEVNLESVTKPIEGKSCELPRA